MTMRSDVSMSPEQRLEALHEAVEELRDELREWHDQSMRQHAKIDRQINAMEATLRLAIMQARRNSEALGVNTAEVDAHIRSLDTIPPAGEREIPTNPQASEKPEPNGGAGE